MRHVFLLHNCIQNQSHLTSVRGPISYRICFMASRSFFVLLFFSTNPFPYLFTILHKQATTLLIYDTVQLRNEENWEENKHLFNFMHHIMAKLSKYIIQSFFNWKSRYRTKKNICATLVSQWDFICIVLPVPNERKLFHLIEIIK